MSDNKNLLRKYFSIYYFYSATMDNRTLNNFYQRIKQSSENHKPYRHRKTHDVDEEVAKSMKSKIEQRKARDKHKRVVSQARMRRGLKNNIINQKD